MWLVLACRPTRLQTFALFAQAAANLSGHLGDTPAVAVNRVGLLFEQGRGAQDLLAGRGITAGRAALPW
ncbi:hypothetical protein [Nonomuraea gerenzanensis]|uniref:hypothetical protein n=1 Tax=Nonomuraea gerenzanensis TaxID=93944 RepID=UPI001CD938E3|nr:hypothetical protein [Nonomuraea gerenzanensis]UBU18660.1 hypothetical protein LCN96_27675 [Nonomuraea gerenzanensis]